MPSSVTVPAPRPDFPARGTLLFRPVLALLLVLVLAGSAWAGWLGKTPPQRHAGGAAYEGGGRTGGDTVADAAVIPGLPFSDSGSTCGFANDYDEVCPYTGSTAPDVVYSYFATENDMVMVDLCASAYDTKVYVWEDTPGNVIGCNDDAGCGYSGWQSRLLNVDLMAGHTYYIVVDGYGGSCGDYSLTVSWIPPCVVECPPGAQQEGEPPCVDEYVDTYNAGCDGGFTPIAAQEGGCGTMCGRGCTYQFQGFSYRDTDWYTVTAAGGTATVTGTAEFPLQLILIYYTHCENLQYVIGQADPCQPIELSWSFPAGQEFWIWVGASVFTGVPESDYVLEVCGIESATDGACCLAGGMCQVTEPGDCQGIWMGAGTDCDPNPCGVPADRASWGTIKNLYR